MFQDRFIEMILAHADDLICKANTKNETFRVQPFPFVCRYLSLFP